MERAPRPLQRLLGDLLVHQQCGAHGDERPHANDAARGDLLGAAHLFFARHERNHLRAADHISFDRHVVLRVRIGGQVGNEVDLRQARGIQCDEAPAARDQRERPALDLPDAYPLARDCSREPAAGGILVNIARLQLQDLQVLPHRGIDGAHICLRQYAPLLQAAEVPRQHQTRSDLLSPLDPPRLHRVLLQDSRCRSSARSAARLCAGAKTLTCGRAACIPCVSGW